MLLIGSLVILSVVFLLGFVTLLLFGLIKAKKIWAGFAFLLLIASIVSGGFAAHTAFVYSKRMYVNFKDWFTPRNGLEAYEALLGKPNPCVEIIHFQDQYIPKIDYAIWLHFKACPEEINRLVMPKSLEFVPINVSQSLAEGPLAHDNWFDPKSMGDTVLHASAIDDYGNGQEWFVSLDSTEVYLMDIWD